MARMIPPVLSPEIKSSAERKIFKLFEESSHTEDWIILHSLGIANHRTLIYGEIDFLVIAPRLGVFALEVKGGRVKREEGMWHFTNRYNQTTSKIRGPFEQAKEAIFSVFDAVRSKAGVKSELNNLLFGFGVMFPDISFLSNDPDYSMNQVYDQSDKEDVFAYIIRLSKYSRQRFEETYGFFPDEKLPNRKNSHELANILRGDFDQVVSISTMVKNAEQEFLQLTQEQLICLDQLQDNPRCLIQGPAGTGKTILAIEQAKRDVGCGKKVAIFCYNKYLSDWIKSYFDEESESLRPQYVGTFHSFLYEVAKKNDEWLETNQHDHEFFSEKLPLYASVVLDKANITFDSIILDEAQDVFSDNYLDILDQILKGGLSRGNWHFFGDFARQAIFSDNDGDSLISLLDSRSYFIKYTLTKNCRNTKPIAQEIEYVTGFENSKYLTSAVTGLPVDYYSAKTQKDNLNTLTQILSNLVKKNNVKLTDITLLSPFSYGKSVCSKMDEYPVFEYSVKLNTGITFSTIQAFKGLESNVIILTDIDTYSNVNLMYTGLSRARSLLIVLETPEAKTQRIEKRIAHI